MIFTSKYLGLDIVIVPARHIMDGMGNKVYVAGKHAKFEGGMFETEDPQIIEFLTNSPRKGIDFVVFKDGQADAEVSEEGKEQLAAEEAARQTTVHSCPKCTFKAKNELGLKAHIRAKHPSEE